jgi:hypothetical protein
MLNLQEVLGTDSMYTIAILLNSIELEFNPLHSTYVLSVQ